MIFLLPSIMFLSTAAVAVIASAGFVAATSNRTTIDFGNLTIAMVRSAPPNWPLPLLNYDWADSVSNISETVDAGIDLINKAARDGASIITFPELWFPGLVKNKYLSSLLTQ